jgi:hypothetical protein
MKDVKREHRFATLICNISGLQNDIHMPPSFSFHAVLIPLTLKATLLDYADNTIIINQNDAILLAPVSKEKD